MCAEVQPMLDSVKNVLTGKVFIYDKINPLSRYNLYKDAYPDLTSIESDIQIKDINLYHDNGYIKAEYKLVIHRKGDYDAGSVGETQWIIKKQNGKWKIVEIIENP